jgi:hypothetical protein
MKTRIIQFVTLTLAGFAALAAEAAVPPTVSDLLDKYTQALDSTQSFISTSESSFLSTSRVPSWGMETHNARSLYRSEERTDGGGHLYGKHLRWGNVGASEQHLTETNARYNLSVVGDDFMYNDDKGLGQTRYKGHVTYQVKGSSEYEKYKATSGYYNGDTVLGYFLGYMSAWRRLDEMLKGARSISMRPKPEIIKGAVCYVLEANTKFGRFTLWLDSEHGYLPARIRASVRVGDDIGHPGSPSVITSQEGITRDYSVDNVRFEKVGDVWVPMEADAKRYVVLGNEHGFSDETEHYKRTKIVLNPDHDALGSFADPMKNPALDPELVNGTIVYLGSGQKNTWQDGTVVDPNGKVVLDLRANIPKAGRTPPGGKK